MPKNDDILATVERALAEGYLRQVDAWLRDLITRCRQLEAENHSNLGLLEIVERQGVELEQLRDRRGASCAGE